MEFMTSGDITRTLGQGYDVDLGDVSCALRWFKVKSIGVAGITRLFKPESAERAAGWGLFSRLPRRFVDVKHDGAGVEAS